jgi:hypothetical protein
MQGLGTLGICAMTHHATISTSALLTRSDFLTQCRGDPERCSLKTPIDAGRPLSRSTTFHKFVNIGCGNFGLLFSARVSLGITIVTMALVFYG